MFALNTDIYELTMAAGYFAAGKAEEIATFELSARRLPSNRNFLLAAGLPQVTEYLQQLSFGQEDIDYLRSLPQFRNTPAPFFEFLSRLRFTGDFFAVPEGTPIFPNEPIGIIRAPIIQAQMVETYLLSTFAFQSSIASKATRCVIAAAGRSVVEFGSRRAHGPEAGVLAARAAYIGGCTGTSNAEAGKRFGIPVAGTAAHSWIMAFPTEREAFIALQKLLGDDTVFLLDTYNTLEAAKLTADLGKPVWGVRLDSGNLLSLSHEVRQILDAAGLQSARIFASNDLDEHKVAELVAAGAPLDAFGIGTSLATSSDAPSISAVYKMVERQSNGNVHFTAKFSEEKSTRPGAKQIYRMRDHDVLALQTECSEDFGTSPLVRPVIHKGQLIEQAPPIAEVREHARKSINGLPTELLDLNKSATYRVEVSVKLNELTGSLWNQHH